MTLKELFWAKGFEYYPTDKDTHHQYLTIYSELFSKWEKETINILEVGTYKNGGLKLFEEYFAKATVVGYDNTLHPGAVGLTRARVFIEDFYSGLRELPELTIAIDDGTHQIEHQLSFVKKVYPKMVSGGIVVVEDVWDGFKQRFDELDIPYTVIEFYPPKDEPNDRLILFRK